MGAKAGLVALILAGAAVGANAQPSIEYRQAYATAGNCLTMAQIAMQVQEGRTLGINLIQTLNLKPSDPLYFLEKDIYEHAFNDAAGPSSASTYAHMVCQNNLERAFLMAASGQQMKPQDIIKPRGR